ncbi:MAG: HAD-IA family hydrolase, partial [Chloroflexi bacterium]|nr:HAD-IA family hydrolase [Chloroflexota bacterium]
EKYEPYPPLWDYLPKLRNQFRLGIVNNGTYLTYPLFEEKYHLNQLFDVFISSAVEGVRKPNPSIYVRASQKLGVSPERCLFMDDSVENIEGARRVGMQTVHWKSKEIGFQQFTKAINSFQTSKAA